MKHDLTTRTWQDDTGCPISFVLAATSDGPPSDDEFEYNNVSCDVSFESYVSFSSDPKHCRHRKKQKKRSKIAHIIARVSGLPVGTLIVGPWKCSRIDS